MRLCYSRVGVELIMEAMTAEEAARMVRKALKLGHLSVLEHASFTFAIEGISRACTHQLVRHRMASYSQQSQRWVKMHDFEVIVPPKIEDSPDRKERFDKAVESLRELYAELVEEGTPREDARYLMPNAAETKIVMSANARSLLNFFDLRLDKTAQWEIRELAGLML
jgi:thymidylate synthase (FAD)